MGLVIVIGLLVCWAQPVGLSLEVVGWFSCIGLFRIWAWPVGLWEDKIELESKEGNT